MRVEGPWYCRLTCFPPDGYSQSLAAKDKEAGAWQKDLKKHREDVEECKKQIQVWSFIQGYLYCMKQVERGTDQ